MKKKKSENRYVANIIDYKNTFETKSGEKVLRHLMKVHGVFTTSFVEDNQYSTAFNEGGKNVILQIIKKVGMDLARLESEMKKQQTEDDNVNY